MEEGVCLSTTKDMRFVSVNCEMNIGLIKRLQYTPLQFNDSKIDVMILTSNTASTRNNNDRSEESI